MSGNALGSQTVALNSGSVLYYAPSGGSTATITNLTLNSGMNELLSAPNGGSNTLAITNLTRNVNLAGGLDPVLNFRSQYGTLGPAGNNGTISVANLNGVALANTNGIIGGWAYASSATTPRDFATLVSGVIEAHTPDEASGTSGGALNSQTLSAALATTNFLANTSAQAVTTNLTINSLIEQNDTYINSGAVLTLASGGYIMRTNNFWLQTTTGNAGTLTSGLASGELFVNTPDAGITDEEIRVSIANDGSTPVTLVKTGQGLLRLNTGAAGYANTYTGGTIIDAGTLQTLAATATLGATGTPLAIDGGTLDLDGTSQAVGNFTGTTGFVLNSSGSTTSTLTIGAGNGTGGNFQGIIENNSGTGGTVALTKVGTGTITLSGANTYTGLTTVNAGTLRVSGSISSGSGLAVGGGTFSYTSTSATQTFNGLTVNAGNSVINAASGGTIAFGALTARNTGGTVDFNTTNTGTITTTAANTNGIFGNGGGWATIGTGTNLQYAVASATAISGLTYSGTSSSVDGLMLNADTSGTNYTMSNTGGALSAARSANTLQFTGASAPTITATTTNTLTLNGLMNDNTATAAISGGDLIAGSINELIFTGPGSFNVSSTVENNGSNASALTMSGSGTLTLSGTNTYTGATYVNAGILSISSNTNLGAVATGATLNLNGGTLQATASIGLDNGAVGTNNRAVVLGSAGGTFDVTSGNTLTIGGVISGTGALTMTDSGTLALVTSANTYSGGTVINSGTILVGSNGNEVATALVPERSRSTPAACCTWSLAAALPSSTSLRISS